MLDKDFLKAYCPYIHSFTDALRIFIQIYVFIIALLVYLFDFIIFKLILGGFNE